MAKKKTGLQKRLRLVKIPTTVYLDPEQVDAIRAIGEATGRPLQAIMREGIDLALAKYSKRRQ